MRARFSQQQPPIKVIQRDGTAYVYICQNETQGQETYPDMGNGQTTETYFEYDYNEIIAPAEALPLEDIQSHPGGLSGLYLSAGGTRSWNTGTGRN